MIRRQGLEQGREWEAGRLDMKERVWRGTMGRGRLEGGNGEGETRRRATGRWGNEEGEMGRRVMGIGAVGRGRWGGGQQGGRGKRWCEHMECLGGMKLQFFLTLLTRATPGTKTSIA